MLLTLLFARIRNRLPDFRRRSSLLRYMMCLGPIFFRRTLPQVFLLTVSLLIARPATAQSIYFYCACPANRFQSGHAFLQLIPSKNNPQFGNPNLCYGFYPAGWNIFGGAGIIKNDSRHAWNWRINYAVNAAQYNAVVGGIRADIAAPPAYHLLRFNCVDWIQKMAALPAPAIALPPTLNRVGVNDPWAFQQSLVALGAGGVFGGGTVSNNAALVAPNGGKIASRPHDISYTWLAARAHDIRYSLSSLATYMHLQASDQNVGIVTVDTPDPFQVDLNNTDPFNALVSMDWGDGSEYDAQSLSFSHQYAIPGTYHASLIVVDTGTIYRWLMTVQVFDGATTGSVTITVPTATVVGGTNAGFDNVIPPDDEQ